MTWLVLRREIEHVLAWAQGDFVATAAELF
jgi:hypothetical protein